MEIRLKLYKLLKSSERLLKTDMIYVAKNASWLMLGQGVSMVFALILSIIFANLLPMQEYGIYKYILSFVGIASAFGLTGMNTAIVQASSRGFDRTLIDAIKITLRWSIVPLTLYLFSAGYYLVNSNLTLAISISCAGILNLLVNSFGLYGSYLVGKQNFKLSTIYSIVTQVINGAAIIITVLITHNVFFLILANFLSTTLLVLLFSILTLTKINTDSKTDISTITFGKHLSVMNILTTLLTHLDKIIVFQKLGAVELAIYSFSVAIPEQLRGTYKNVLGIATPKFANLSKEKLRLSIIKKIYTLTALTILVVGAYILLAPIIFQILFPKYLESILYSQIYILGLIAIPSIMLFTTYFQVQQKTSALYRINFISNIVGLSLTVIFIYAYGLLGAALLNIATRLTSVFISIFYFQKDNYQK